MSIDNKTERRPQGTKAELGAYSMDDLLKPHQVYFLFLMYFSCLEIVFKSFKRVFFWFE